MRCAVLQKFNKLFNLYEQMVLSFDVIIFGNALMLGKGYFFIISYTPFAVLTFIQYTIHYINKKIYHSLKMYNYYYAYIILLKIKSAFNK